MYVIESKFGNDGYAFWFKLLELLGITDGHVYDYNNPADKEFLLAKTRVSEDKAVKILDLLAELDSIDKQLWQENYIWSDNFVSNISDAYSRRKVNVPQKPTTKEVNVAHKPDSHMVYAHKNTQSKVKYSKEKKSKETVPYQQIKNLYNKICKSLPSVRKLSDRRKKHIKTRWNEEKNIGTFKTVFEKAEQSSFMTGNNNRNWTADFDWIIKNNNNFNKVLEGKYDDKKKNDNMKATVNYDDITEMINDV